jgi:hypothetical protein
MMREFHLGAYSRPLLFVLGAGIALGRTIEIPADRDFNLGSQKIRPAVGGALLAQAEQLVFTQIGESQARIIVATPDGVIRSMSPAIVNVHEQIYRALPRADGKVWLASRNPRRLADSLPALGFGAESQFIQLDLYTPAGELVDSARIVGPVTPFTSLPDPIGVWNHGIAFRAIDRAMLASVRGGNVQEVASFPEPEVFRGAWRITPEGKVVIIQLTSGRYQIGNSPVMQIPGVHKVIAAAFRDGSLYAVDEPHGPKVRVLKGDVAYDCVMRHPFRPRLIDVSGNHIYLANFAGRGERFSLPVPAVQ